MRCHPFKHEWVWDEGIGAERCRNCHCLGEENDYGFTVTIKCSCGAWASHYGSEHGWSCHNHRERKEKGLRGALLG